MTERSLAEARPRPVPARSVLDLRAPRVRVPAAPDWVVSTAVQDRAAHAGGPAYPGVGRALSGELRGAPDAVAFPRSEAAIVRLLDWAGTAGVAVVPFGGGSSVVGGVEYRAEGPWLSLDLTGLDRVLEIDPVPGRRSAGRGFPAAVGASVPRRQHAQPLLVLVELDRLGQLGGPDGDLPGDVAVVGPAVDCYRRCRRLTERAGCRREGEGRGPGSEPEELVDLAGARRGWVRVLTEHIANPLVEVGQRESQLGRAGSRLDQAGLVQVTVQRADQVRIHLAGQELALQHSGHPDQCGGVLPARRVGCRTVLGHGCSVERRPHRGKEFVDVVPLSWETVRGLP